MEWCHRGRSGEPESSNTEQIALSKTTAYGNKVSRKNLPRLALVVRFRACLLLMRLT